MQVDLALVGKSDLRRTEPPHRTAERSIGIYTIALDIDIFDLIGARCLNCSTICHRYAVRSVSPRVTNDCGLHRKQPALIIAACFHSDQQRMTLRRGEIRLFSTVNIANRSFQMIQGQSDESLHVEIEFGAKSTAGNSLN